MEQTTKRRINILASHIVQPIPLSLNPTSAVKDYHEPPAITVKSLISNYAAPYFAPIHKYVGWFIIPDGEAAAVWDSSGSIKLVKGPTSYFLLNEKIAIVQRYTATFSEYLRITHKDGTVEHIPGPQTIFFNPKIHQTISVEPGVNVPDGYAIVVFEKNDENITRKVVRGPTLHILKSNQTLHTFYWGIPDQKVPIIRNRKIHKFNKLRIMPDQFYIDLEDVRTADDALVTVKIMIFYRLIHVEQMLSTTHDPVAEMMNNLTADVIEFASSRSFETFKKSTEVLNSLEGYPQLLERAKNMGYEVTKVVYRGYQASVKLQEMHNNAIEARTQLKLKAETESQAQDLEDLKQSRNQERTRKDLQLTEETTHHDLKLEKQNQEFKLKMSQLQHNEEMRKKQVEGEFVKLSREDEFKAKEEHEKRINVNKLEYYKGLKEQVAVDVSGYLKSQYKQADKVVKIVTPKPGNVNVTD